MSRGLRILGIDPGSRTTGYGLVESDGRSAQRLASGCIRPKSSSLAQALAAIYGEIAERIAIWRPEAVAVEAVFHQHHARSALVLGQARGAALAACGLAGVHVAEYAPADVKSSVTGYGAADKGQVQRMVAVLLGLAEPLAADEADALAVALCHSQRLRLSAAVQRSDARPRASRPGRAT